MKLGLRKVYRIRIGLGVEQWRYGRMDKDREN